MLNKNAIVDVLMEQYKADEMAAEAIDYYGEFVSDMKSDEWDDMTAQQIEEYVSSGKAHTEVANLVTDMMNSMRDSIIAKIRQSRIRIKQVQYDQNPDAPIGAIASFTLKAV